MCYGERIKQYLDDNGIKHRVLAQRTGIPTNTLSPMLNGKRKIVIDEYFKICDALEKPYDYFATDETKTA